MFIYLWFVYTTGATLLRFNRQKKVGEPTQPPSRLLTLTPSSHRAHRVRCACLQAFYGLFFCVYSVWLVALPITCLVSSQLLPRSYQNKVCQNKPHDVSQDPS